MIIKKYKERKAHKMKSRTEDKIFVIVNSTILTVAFLIFLYPIWFVLIASFSDPGAVNAGEVFLLPKGFDLAGYKRILQTADVWIGYGNTIFYTVFGTFLNLAVTVMGAYALARKDFKIRTFIMIMLLIPMYFQGGMIPGYLNVKSLGLVDTRLALLLVGLIAPTNVIICRTYFSTAIPWELHEAAFIDGANDFRIFTKIALPLARPILAVMVINYGVAHWNDYFNAMIYLKDRSLFPLQLFLREIIINSQLQSTIDSGTSLDGIASAIVEQNTASQLKYALIVVSTIPILAVYPFLEKYFEKGFMIGSVKG